MLDDSSWRIPQPRTGEGRELAEDIWKKRHELSVVTAANAPDTSHVVVNSALTMRIVDKTHLQFAMATRETWRTGGECSVQYSHFCFIVSDDRARWIVHAWRATQAARLLSILGEHQDVGDAPICVVTLQPEGRLARMMLRFAPTRRPTAGELLERALDAAVRRRIEALPPSSVMTDRVDIGNDVSIDASLWAPILAVHHPIHGTFALPGEAARTFNARVDAMRERSMAAVHGPHGRIDRVMAICREAIAMDPDMTDQAGTPIAPLIEKHLPRLAERRRDAIASSSSAERREIDTEVDETLQMVTDAVEKGMATRARIDRDALRNELRFLSMRHPTEERRELG